MFCLAVVGLAVPHLVPQITQLPCSKTIGLHCFTLASLQCHSLHHHTLQVDLVEIKQEFLKMYHKTLFKMIEGDTSGDYRK